jgi:ribosome biogenesis GTPase
LVANIDAVFIVSSLNRDFNLRRMERYLVLTWESGVNPVIVLNKADLCEDVYSKITEISSIAPGVPVHAISCETGQGLDQLTPYLGTGKTVALLGSSGVGKSTLLNCLLGESIKRTGAVRSQDSRGRHTTTHRQMHLLPRGGLVIDTPGLRELRLWGSDEGISSTCEDIEEYSVRCRFNDCRHQGEPGCAVMEALESGVLDWARYQSYLKLQKEMAYISRKENLFEALEEKEKWKQIHKEIKRIKKR